ncbi:TetR/AcrR family transcriptional regulator [Streptomyces sp. enrichment culture]|uniref:TetR/AcrR family transcriptional regulator n=1 Tax=Streptomyces sp. enrichment culture TaxID=1795815 RepID=UPI003F55CA9B
MTNAPVVKPLRSDAVRSRRLLVEAAAEAFAEHGAAVSVSQIAERAGIGKGTVFRHFPTKEDLLAAIICENMYRLVAVGERLLAADDPTSGLRDFMGAAIEMQTKDRAFCQVVHGEACEHPEVRLGQEKLDAVTEALTDRARRYGGIRPEVTGQDIMLLMSGIYQTAAPMLATRPQLWRRYLQLAFDGMQATGAPSLP